jgi:hypothetical protein
MGQLRALSYELTGAATTAVEIARPGNSRARESVVVSTDDLQRLSGKLDAAMIGRAVGAIEIDAALDERDETSFEKAWNSCYDTVSPSESRLDDAERALITSICERAFKLTFAATDHPELAGCVSDDFGLIAGALVCDLEDAFAAYLLDEYMEGRLPSRVTSAPAKSLTAVLGRHLGG